MASDSGSRDVFIRFLKFQLEALSQDVKTIAIGDEQLVLRHLPGRILLSLCDHVKSIFAEEETVIDLVSPVAIIGDLHGHYLDLIRVIQLCGLPDHEGATKYLFLGDIVDRGEFSLETVTLIYLMKAAFPTRVFVIRGNHEFESLCSRYGFLNEITAEYTEANQIFRAFLSSFAQMPIGAVIDEVSVCLHGGIGPSVPNLDVIRDVRKPIDDVNSPVIASVFWSDPSESVVGFKPSPRGMGYRFGHEVALDFLEQSQAVRLVRGHECVQEGFSIIFSDRVVTVFSASNYCGVSNNAAAVFIMDPDGNDELKRLAPLPYFRRTMATFVREVGEGGIIQPSLKDSLSYNSILKINDRKVRSRGSQDMPTLGGYKRQRTSRRAELKQSTTQVPNEWRQHAGVAVGNWSPFQNPQWHRKP